VPIVGLATAVVAGALLVVATPAAADPTPVPGDPLTGSGAVNRSVLTAAELTGGTSSGTVSDSAFALPSQAAPPLHEFEGSLTLHGLSTAGGSQVVKDLHGYAGAPERHHLPPVSVGFVQNGSHLIPNVRGLQYTGHAVWNLAVGPGRAWRENGDGGMTRAAVPFAVIERNANCTHNGVLTFLFDDTTTSDVRYQVTSETCLYFQLDMWGQVEATYDAHPVPGAATLREDYAAEVAGRLPTKPIDALATDHPAAGVDTTVFGSGVSPTAMTSFGLLYDGVNYVGECHTRQGQYPFCDQLLLPSYSTAKSAFAGLALLRLAQRYGPEVGDELIEDHVPESVGRSGWAGVTFRDALNMATGNYDSAAFFADEGGARMLDFFLAESYNPKMSHALGFPDRVAPGTTWVYQTSATFVVTQAMDNYLKSQEPGEDIFAMLRVDVLAPAGVGPDALSTLRTDNDPSGGPFGGYGLFWTRDDIAKVARLINNDDGVIGGEQVLHAGLLDATMQRNPASRGMDTTGTPSFKYHHGFWAHQFTTADDPAYTEPFWVPFMSGFGGITVAMLPNGATYWYFSDNDEFSWYGEVREAHKLPSLGGGPGPGCEPAQLIGNGGFETGSASPWSATAGVVDNRWWFYPARTGSWKAWLNGFGYNSTDTLSQTVSIPSDCGFAELEFYLWIHTAETDPVAYDTLEFAIVAAGNTEVVETWSNLDSTAGYVLQTFDLADYSGTTVTLRFTGIEDHSLQTSFLIDDVTLTVS
jgi:hypothetical protein